VIINKNGKRIKRKRNNFGKKTMHKRRIIRQRQDKGGVTQLGKTLPVTGPRNGLTNGERQQGSGWDGPSTPHTIFGGVSRYYT